MTNYFNQKEVVKLPTRCYIFTSINSNTKGDGCIVLFNYYLYSSAQQKPAEVVQQLASQGSEINESALGSPHHVVKGSLHVLLICEAVFKGSRCEMKMALTCLKVVWGAASAPVSSMYSSQLNSASSSMDSASEK